MAVDIPAARECAVTAARNFYTREHGPLDHITAERDARDAVTFAVDIADISHREIAVLAGMPGLLVAQLIDAPKSRVEALRLERHAAERYTQDVMAAIQRAAVQLVREGGRGIESQQGFATAAGVDRMTVREWLGLRQR